MSPARSPRPETALRELPLNFSQVGMVALSAVKLKRKTPPVGIETWTTEAVQERLLEVVKQKNVDVEVTISIALNPM